MNYDRIYQELMAAARCRGADKSKLGGSYYERHHIVPRCLGGSNDEANLVLLTAREHFVAHRLLAKMHPSNNKLLFAVSAFRMRSGKSKRLLTSRQVALAREAHSAVAKGHSAQLVAERKHLFQDSAFIQAQSRRKSKQLRELALQGLHPNQTQSTRARQSVNATKRNLKLAADGAHHFQTEAIRQKTSDRNRALAREGLHPAQSETSRQLFSNKVKALAQAGLHPSQSPEGKARIREVMTRAHTCPHCGKEGKGNSMLRWHFENCKHKETQAND